MRTEAPACPPKARAVEHQHRKPFRGGVNRGGKTGRSSADHRHVEYSIRIELRRDAETGAGFRISRPLQHRSVRAEHQRQLFRSTPDCSSTVRPSAVGRVEHLVGISVAAEKALEPREIRGAWNANEHRADAALSSMSPTRRKMKARIMTSPISAEPIIKART